MYSSPESGSASRKGSSVVPGLPNRWRPPSARRISIRTCAACLTGEGSGRAGARLLEDLLGPRGVEHAAGAEASQIPGGLVRGATPLLDPLEELLDEIVGDHAVAAHGSDLENHAVRQPLDPALEAERGLHAVPLDPRLLAAPARRVPGGADVDGPSQVGVPEVPHERFHVFE